MTQAEYAAHRGVKPSAVSNWKKAGHVVFAEGDDGRLYVDRARTDARLNARIDQTRGRPTSSQASQAQAPASAASGPLFSGEPAEPSGLAQVRTDLIRQQTIGKTLDNARRAGELVPAMEYERRASEFGRLARERMHSVVRNQSERLSAERDPRQITLLLTEEIDLAFAELADQVQGGALAQDDDDDQELTDESPADLVDLAAG